jgi:hypothetical protein
MISELFSPTAVFPWIYSNQVSQMMTVKIMMELKKYHSILMAQLTQVKKRVLEKIVIATIETIVRITKFDLLK